MNNSMALLYGHFISYKKVLAVSHIVMRHPKITLALAGVATGGVFSWQYPAILLPFLLTTLFVFITNATKFLTTRTSIKYILSFFIPFQMVVFSWFLDADLNSLAGISKHMSFFTSVFCIFMMVFVTTTAMFPIMFAFYKAQRTINQRPLRTILIIASAWVVSEWLRSLVFGAYLYGSQGTIGDFWNFGSLGLAVMSTPLSYASRIVGMYGLSFGVVVISGGVYQAIFHKRPKLLLWASVIMILLSIIGFYLYNYDSDSIRQGSVMQSKNLEDSMKSSLPIDNFKEARKDLIVLPEYSYVYQGTQAEFVNVLINKRLRNDGFSIGVTEGTQAQRYGTLEFRNNHSQILETQTKEFLIPTGEYLPAVFTTFYNLTGQSRIVREFDSTRKLTKGDTPRPYISSRLTVGPVACSGILGRNIYRNLSLNGAEVFTNSASLATLNNSKSYYRQSMQMAQFHSVANNRVYIQSTKGAPAFVLDKDGKFIVSPDDIKSKFIDFEFMLSNKKTIYTLLGDWVLWLSVLASICAVISYTIRNRRQVSK